MNKNNNLNIAIEPTYIYYSPGDLVILKHKELKSPIMLVKEKVTRQFKQGNELCNIFKGLKCV